MTRILVALQFTLITALLWPSGTIALSMKTTMAAASLAAGLALFMWSFVSLPRASFSIMPEPKKNNELCEFGPYRYVRHPMYTSVLLCAVSAATIYDQAWKWLAVLTLGLVLWIKLTLEERLLKEKHNAYAEYVKRTKALVPLVI